MKLWLSIGLLHCFSFGYYGLNAQSQFFMDSTMTTTELIEDHLLAENLGILNAKFNGLLNAPVSIFRGQFEAVDSPFPFETGSILCTGPMEMAFNGFYNTGNSLCSGYSDPDLELLSGVPVNCASVIEFDFQALGNELSFDFIFASKEYISYVCSEYNDAFGIFLSGPGISGPYENDAINIATIPGTDTPISVNTINSGTPSIGQSSATCLAANPDFVEHSQYYYQNNNQGEDIWFFGYTLPLTATYPLECGGTYHIKFGIGDVVDEAVKSAVFIEGGTLTTSGPILDFQVSSATSPLDDTVYENCGINTLTINRLNHIDEAQEIMLNYGGDALMEDDYSTLPESISFAPGQTEVSYTFEVFEDLFIEGTEIVTISLSLCDGEILVDQYEFSILDYEPLEIIAINNQYDCGTVSSSPVVTGGIPPYTYTWTQNGAILSTEAVLTLNEPLPAQIELSVGDFCGSTVIEALSFEDVPDPLSLQAPDSLFALNCLENVTISVLPSGGIEPYTYTWIFSDEPMSQNGPIVNSSFQESGFLTVQVRDVCGNSAVAEIFIEVFQPDLFVSLPDDTTVCAGNSVMLSSEISGGVSPYNYSWTSGEAVNQIVVSPDKTTAITVEVRDACGSFGSASTRVAISEVQALFSYSILNLFEVSFENRSIPDGISHYWEFGDGTISQNVSPSHNYQELEPFEVVLTVTDQYGCSDNGSALIEPPMQVYIPNAFSPNGDGLNDLFKIEGIGIESIEISIHDRWGQQVFSEQSLDIRWNGSVEGSEYFAQPGIYNYRVVIRGYGVSEVFEKFGFITVVR